MFSNSQQIKWSFSLSVNFLSKNILKSWKTFLPYFNCMKPVCARSKGRHGGRGSQERERRGETEVGGRGSGEKRGRRAKEEWRVKLKAQFFLGWLSLLVFPPSHSAATPKSLRTFSSRPPSFILPVLCLQVCGRLLGETGQLWECGQRLDQGSHMGVDMSMENPGWEMPKDFISSPFFNPQFSI